MTPDDDTTVRDWLIGIGAISFAIGILLAVGLTIWVCSHKGADREAARCISVCGMRGVADLGYDGDCACVKPEPEPAPVKP